MAKKNNTILLIGIVLIAVLVLPNLVVAQEVIAESPTLWERFKSLFRFEEFTIVGQDLGASVDYNEFWNNIQPSTSFLKYADDYCPSGYGLFDVYVDNWVPRFEMKNKVEFTCGSQNQKCMVELYCMPRDFCSYDSDCPSDNECIFKTATDPYMPLIDANTGNPITTYSYCTPTEACTGADINCWRIIGDECSKRTYDCNYETYPNCPTSYPYTSLSSCEAGIEEPDDECLADGKYNYLGGKDCCSGCQTDLRICEPCPSNGVPDLPDPTPTAEQPPECITEQGIFYTDGYAIIGKGNFKFLGYASETTSGDLAVINTKDLQEVIPGLSAKYYENRATTCCKDLKALFEDEKTFSYSRTDFNLFKIFGTGYLSKVLDWFGVETEDDISRIAVTYSIYKCVDEEELGFCLEFTHRWLNKYTKTDDCQTNTIIFIILIVAGFVAISRFAG